MFEIGLLERSRRCYLVSMQNYSFYQGHIYESKTLDTCDAIVTQIDMNKLAESSVLNLVHYISYVVQTIYSEEIYSETCKIC